MREKNNAVKRAAVEATAKIISKAEAGRGKREREEDKASSKAES